MKFHSTRNQDQFHSLREAVLKGLPDDGGLFVPAGIPVLSSTFLSGLPGLSFQEIGTTVAKAFLADEVNEQDIRRIVEASVSFDAPLADLHDNTFALELFHGPTLAFKDFGARFMARLVSHFIGKENRRITILVATSGDTGSAVAHGFHGVEGIDVVILYPSGKVSMLQEKQLTTLGGNIAALEVKGTFDDCQRMVKDAFLDKEISSRRQLTSANSINISRLIPQTFYYFRAVAQHPDSPVVFSVPSGNFGNLTAGLMAKRMGLSVKHFVAATNSNDVVPEYLRSGNFKPNPSVQTISNAMDVGNPSNFERMLHLYNGSVAEMRKDISGFAFSDAGTREAMRMQYNENGYILDPHGAVGLLGLQQYRSETHDDSPGIILETAHPAKFISTVEETLSLRLDLPPALEDAAGKEKKSVVIDSRFELLKQYLLS